MQKWLRFQHRNAQNLTTRPLVISNIKCSLSGGITLFTQASRRSIMPLSTCAPSLEKAAASTEIGGWDVDDSGVAGEEGS